MKFLEDLLLPVARKLAENKYLSAIRDGFIAIMPLMIIGSFFILINNVIIGPNGIFFKLFQLELAPLTKFGAVVAPATLSIMSLLLAFTTAKKMCEIEGLDDTIIPAVAVVNFLILVPFIFDGNLGIEYVNTFYLGSPALFLSFTVAIITIVILKKLQQIKQIRISMPESVPTGVSRSFNLLVPILLVVFMFAGLRLLIDLTGQTTTELVFSILQQPFSSLVNSPIGLVIIFILYMLLWGFGVHTAFIFGPILEPIYLMSINQNMQNVEQGKAMVNIITKPFLDSVAFMGGAGNMFALIIAIFIISRRADYRSIAKLGVAPGLFNISEPIMFGLPVVMNPILIIPMILSTLFGIGLGVLSTMVGFMGHTYILTPWTTPPILSAFLSTGGNIGAAITALVILVGSVFIYLPFVQIMNQQKPSE